MKILQNRFSLFFILLFVTVIFLISDAVKYNNRIKSAPKEQKSVIIAKEIKFLRADENRTLYRGFVTKAKKEQESETLYGCNIKGDDDKNQTLFAPVVQNFKNEAVFSKGFVFKSLDGNLKTSSATYDKKNELLKGNEGFQITSQTLNAEGKSFVYNVKQKSLEADKIEANIDEKVRL